MDITEGITTTSASRYIKDKFRYSTDFGAFITEVLGLKYEPFHREWIELIENNSSVLLLAPRSHSKTWSLGSYITWKIVNNPNIRVLIITINQDMANGMMRFVKRHLEENEKLIELFGPQKTNIMWSNEALIVRGSENRKEPTLKVIGITGGMIGGHHDIIVCDDITDKDNSKTEHRRKGLVFQFENDIMPMLESDKGYGKIIVTGTRWHQSDIYSYLSNIPDYKVRKYQAIISESDKLKEYVKSVSKLPDEEFKATIRSYIERLPEEERPVVLWEEKMPYEELVKRRRNYGNVSFMMQYQNEFISGSDNPIKWDWIQSARDNYKLPEHPFEAYMGVDLASREGTGDYFTITVVVIKEGLIYIVDGFRDRLSLFGQSEAIRELYKKWNVMRIGIEQVGPQKIVVEDLQDRLAGYPIVPVKSSSVNDKLGRVQVLSQLFETGRVFLNPKLVEWIDELASYPRGAHEDTIDSLSFAVQVSKVEDDKKPINWADAIGMVSARKVDVKSVGRRKYDFIKI